MAVIAVTKERRAGETRVAATPETVKKLIGAGFKDIEVEPTREYSIEDARTFLAGEGLDVDTLALQTDGSFASAFIRATKKEAACCSPGCCA